MSWVKLDDGFPEHQKVDRLSDRAFRLHVAALCHCGRNLTDGLVDAGRPRRLVQRYRPALVLELVDAGLWDEVEEGWEIHDYLRYNPSKEKVVAEREAAAERMRKVRDSPRSGRSSPERSPVRSPSPARPVGPRAGLSLTSVVDDEPAPSGVSSRLPEEQVELNVSQAQALKEQLRGS